MLPFELTELPDDALPVPEELPGDWARIAELIGVRNTLILAQEYRGTYIYCRNLDHLIREHLYNCIVKDAETMTVAEITRKYPYVERHIYTILKQPTKAELTQQKQEPPRLF